MIVEKKCWPELFELVQSGEKNADLRLADFKLNAGDTLVFKEFDPKTKKFTGRSIEKKCKAVHKLNPKMFPLKEIQKHGFYLIELE